jgi:hypothetical protein
MTKKLSKRIQEALDKANAERVAVRNRLGIKSLWAEGRQELGQQVLTDLARADTAERKRQSDKGKKRHVRKLTYHLKGGIPEVIEELLVNNEEEVREEGVFKALWPKFCDRLELMGLNPTEKDSRDPKKAVIVYSPLNPGQKKRHKTYRSFANDVSTIAEKLKITLTGLS